MAGNLLKDAAPGPPATDAGGWTTGRILALATGSVLLLISLALIGSGGTLTWADQEQLHSGYLTTSTATYSTSGYAVASDPAGVLLGLAAAALIIVPVRLAARPRQ